MLSTSSGQGAAATMRVRDARSVLLHSVADRRAGVEDGVGDDRRGADLPRVVGHVVEVHPRGNARELDREERRRQVARDPLGQRASRRRRSPDVQLRLLVPDRAEEAEAFDVVDVQVREQEVDRLRAAAQGRAEPADAGARVEDEQRPVREAELDARRVAAVRHRVRSRCRERPAAAPDPREHYSERSQKMATTPTSWSSLHAVEARQAEVGVRLATLQQRDAGRDLPERHRRAVDVLQPEELGPALGRHLARLGERLPEDHLGGLVVEDEPPLGIGDEHRRRQLRGELSREDEHEVLLPRGLHRLSVDDRPNEEGAPRSALLDERGAPAAAYKRDARGRPSLCRAP